jgi:hypothetical protein
MVLEKRKISYSCRDSSHGQSIPKPSRYIDYVIPVSRWGIPVDTQMLDPEDEGNTIFRIIVSIYKSTPHHIPEDLNVYG